MTKRTLDILMAGTVLLVLFPVVISIATVSLISQGRPILFTQERAGLQGNSFRIVKFRTMRRAQTLDWCPEDDAVRLTRLGNWLRATSLDEVPSLWNVLRGDMSLVGPRPLPLEYTNLYTPRQASRLLCRPGLTGLAQVEGRNLLSWKERFELDAWYVENRTLLVDLKILAKTPYAVLSRRGVSAPGHVTMPRFEG